MLNGIMETAQKYGYTILICNSMDNPEKELKNITALCKHKIDGVIWEPVSESSSEYEHYFKEQEILYLISTVLLLTPHRLDFDRWSILPHKASGLSTYTYCLPDEAG